MSDNVVASVGSPDTDCPNRLVGAESERLVWVDCFKGLSITLVVFGHVVGGLMMSGIIPEQSLFCLLRSWVYLFHMPAFFFAAGLFAQKSVKHSFGEFLRSRAATLMYPYCLWTLIVVACQWALARHANNPPDFSKATRFLYEPYGYGLWFLYSLMLISLVYQVIRRFGLSGVVAAVIGVVLYEFSNFDLFSFWPILNNALGFLVYFVLGAVFRNHLSHFLEVKSSSLCLIYGLGALAIMTALFMVSPTMNWMLPLIIAALGVLGLVGIAKSVVAIHLERFWSYAGRHSLEIYLGHILLATLPRPFLKAAGVAQPWIFLICGVACGLLGSLGLASICENLKFPYLYRWPLSRTSTNRVSTSIVQPGHTVV